MISRLIDTYFFTATINSWQHLLGDDAFKWIIIDSLKYCVMHNRIILHGFVIMPNHIHLLLTLGKEETHTIFQRDFLKFTAQQIIKLLLKNRQQHLLNNYKATQKDRIYHIWERRPKWIEVLNMPIFMQKLNYIHQNPVQKKWNLCKDILSYKWSSAAYYESGKDDFDILISII